MTRAATVEEHEPLMASDAAAGFASATEVTQRTRLLRSAALVSLLSIGVSVISFINQLVIAKLFGAGPSMDAYLVAVSVPMLAMGIVNGFFSYTIVPELVWRKTRDIKGYRSLLGVLSPMFVLIAVCLPISMYPLAPVIIGGLASSRADLPPYVITIARVSWAATGCSLLVNYLVAMHNTEERFTLPTAVTMLPFACMTVSSLVLGSRLGTASLSWGLLGGYLLSIPILFSGIRPLLTFKVIGSHEWPKVRELFARMPLVVASMLCFTVFGTSDAYWASQLGPSQVSYLGYAQRIIIAVGTLVIIGPSTVLTPYLSQQAAAGRHDHFLKTMGRAMRGVFVLASPIALIISLLRTSLVELLFQRGAFDAIATRGVAGTLPGTLFGMIAMVAVVLMFRALYARGDLIGASVIGGAGSILYFVGSGILSDRFGLQGIIGAYMFTWWTLLAISAQRVWRRDLWCRVSRSTLAFGVQLVGALTVCLGLTLLGKMLFVRPLAEVGRPNLFAGIAGTTVLGSIGFLGVSAGLFRMPELTAALETLPLRFRIRKQGRVAKAVR